MTSPNHAFDACLSLCALSQGPGGISGPAHAEAGSLVTVRVGGGHTSIVVHLGGPAETSYPVSPSGEATFPVPSVPPGTVVVVVAGKGLRKSIHYIEVVALSS